MSYHQPAMAQEALDGLAIRPDGIYVDATFGGGGHTRLILEQLGPEGRILGFDQDADAQENVPADGRFAFVPHNFRYLQRFLKLYGYREVDGILADLGVSSHQFDEGDRGFSYRFSGTLDMRMDQQSDTTAADIVNRYPAADLQRIFSQYGEVRNARTLAQRICETRELTPIRTTTDLLQVVDPLVRGQRMRYLAQVFQALRIEVNQEMTVLEEFLEQTLAVLKPGGRLVVIAYHSVEDRMVKNFLRSGRVDGKMDKDFYGNIFRPFAVLTKKALGPTEVEIQKNPRARSARMRIGVRKAATHGKA